LLEGGAIKAKGTFDELTAKDTQFNRMARHT